MGLGRYSETEIRQILSESRSGTDIAELYHKHGIEESTLLEWKERYELKAKSEPTIQHLEEENRNLRHIVADLLLEKRVLLQHRVSVQQMQDAGTYCGVTNHDQDVVSVSSTEPSSPQVDERIPAERHELDGKTSHVEASPIRPLSEMHKSVRVLLERSRIIPAIRSSEFLPAAIASPALVVSLLYGSPLTIGDVVGKLRYAGKLPLANLNLLTGFAQDADAVSLLVKLGVAGIVSTRQSALRAAQSQGIIAVQRTFAVDTIALHNITRALHHFVPHALELLPAVAAPLAMPPLRASTPDLPVIATGLVNSPRQVDEFVRHGITAVATSSTTLWIL
jgi:glycerol uptake operon antiterminator